MVCMFCFGTVGAYDGASTSTANDYGEKERRYEFISDLLSAQLQVDPAFQVNSFNALSRYPGLQGKIVKQIPFSDATGNYVVVFTYKYYEKDDPYFSDPEYILRNKEMFVYMYKFNWGNTVKVWRIYDYNKNCDDINSCILRLKDVRITDVDKNGQAEIWITYAMHYGSDVSPSTMKIIMYEGNKKHAMRGCDKVCWETSDCYYGGNYKADAAMRENPVFARYAKQLWEKMAIKDSSWHPSCAKKKQCSNPDCSF